MQNLISIDHESRNNSYRDEIVSSVTDMHYENISEQTPLLQGLPQNNTHERNRSTVVIVSLLLILLLSGVLIGIYLLILQSESENVLPPVETPLQFVSRIQWDRDKLSHNNLSSMQFTAKQIIVVQTNTRECNTTSTCTNLLQEMQDNATVNNYILPYNFMISSNGQTYEVLGWHVLSPMFPEYSKSALVLGFIGNFLVNNPPEEQIKEAKYFISVSISRKYLDPSYLIFGRYTNETSNKLFPSLMELPHWSKELSD